MKYSAHLYAKALDAALLDPKADQARIAKNFLALVRRNGDEAYLRKILEEAGRFARGRGMIQKVTIESARELTKPQRDLVKRYLKPDDIVEHEIDPGLIAGITIIVNDEMQFDGSLKAKLDSLFGATV